jgi:hypothetical protein
LNDCGAADITISNRQEAPIKDMVGYSFRYNSSSDPNDGGWIYYRNLGLLNGNPVLLVDYSGGGSGHFSSIREIKLDGHVLQNIKYLASGDRCQGAISDARIVGGSLNVESSITPTTLLKMAVPLPQPNPSWELDDSPQGNQGNCFAAARTQDGKLISISISRKYLINTGPSSEVQLCFNNLFGASLDRGKSVLKSQELTQLLKRFFTECVNLASASGGPRRLSSDNTGNLYSADASRSTKSVWVIQDQASQLDGTTSSVASVQSTNKLPNNLLIPETAILAVRCKSGGVDVVVEWPAYMGRYHHMTRWKFDDGAIEQDIWEGSTNGMATFSNDAMNFVNKIANASKLVLASSTTDQLRNAPAGIKLESLATHEVVFDLSGARSAMQHVVEACRK